MLTGILIAILAILFAIGAISTGLVIAGLLRYLQIRYKFKQMEKEFKINLDDCE